MGLALLSLVGLLIAAYMLLYKLGVIEQVACGTGACASVQESPFAVFLGIPVPLWGVIGYGAILVLSLIGLQENTVTDRRFALALLLMCAYAFGFSLYLTWVEAALIRAWCRWCVGSAIVATLLFLLSLAEVPRLRQRAHA
jgi:uncharacterized membrane protein